MRDVVCDIRRIGVPEFEKSAGVGGTRVLMKEK